MQIDRRALLAAAGAFPFVSGAGLAFAQGADGPPKPRRQPVTDDVFGTRVTDPYRWMENTKDPDFLPYLKAQGAYAQRVLGAIPGRPELASAIARYTGGLTAVTDPQVAGPWLFLEERPPGANTYKLMVQPLSGGDRRVLIDPDAPADGKKRALNYWLPSPDGALVLFGVSEAGSEDAVLQVIETASGKVLADRIDRTQYASPSWTNDGRAFYFNRLASTDKTSLDYYKHSVCWRHVVGTDPAQDVKALAQGQYAGVPVLDTEFPSITVTPGSDTALGGLFNGVQTEITLYAAPLASLGKADTPWVPVCKPADKITGYTQRGDELYLVTYAGAPRYKLIRTRASKPDLATAGVVVPPSDILLDGAGAARDGVYLFGRDAKGVGSLRRLHDDGRIETLALPFEGSIVAPFTDPRLDGAWFLLTGWTHPPVVCRVGADGKVVATDFAPPPPYDTSVYASETILATAKDGAKVPLSIVYRKGLKRDGSAPTILTAYGSYGISLDPSFVSRYLAWLDLGGVYAVGHVRGGGELGRDWYEAGKKATKPNTWRDLIACAETLVAERWTSRPKLAIEGTSAGGITVGRALTERPDLFAVVFSRVGVSDAARSEFSPNGPPNIPEFGSVQDKDTAQALLAMDAYYAVKDGTKYPSVVFTTGLTDPRVSPWEPGKMAARLQSATASGNPVILRVEAEGGHGVGSTRSQFDLEYADLFAFALWRMGDPRYQPFQKGSSAAKRS
jgi:prolyl oligopeptidase